jgi:hypothetical protein
MWISLDALPLVPSMDSIINFWFFTLNTGLVLIGMDTR